MAEAGRLRKAASLGCLLVLAALFGACGGKSSAEEDATASPPAGQHDKLLIVGQDLGAIRGYMASDCCSRPDGFTAYVDFYDILKEGDFGGLGINTAGEDAGFEFDWGAGPVGAYQTATEFGIDGIAIGLSITENEHPGKLQRLVDGEFDAEIRQLARFMSQIDGPVYLRIGYEFDGAWNQGYEDAPRYIVAWHRIVDVLRQEGADNFLTVWQAGASSADEIIDQRHENITRWYPGDEYVDWMAFSWFMQPNEKNDVPSAHEPATPLELTEELLAFARQRNKPVMIAEASPQAIDINEKFMANHAGIWDGEPASGQVDMTNDEIWDHWFGPLFQLMNDNRDVIHILAYINADWDSQDMWGPPYASGFWGDSRLEANDDIAARFNAAIENWKKGK